VAPGIEEPNVVVVDRRRPDAAAGSAPTTRAASKAMAPRKYRRLENLGISVVLLACSGVGCGLVK
jgi:hypothetical protein